MYGHWAFAASRIKPAAGRTGATLSATTILSRSPVTGTRLKYVSGDPSLAEVPVRSLAINESSHVLAIQLKGAPTSPRLTFQSFHREVPMSRARTVSLIAAVAAFAAWFQPQPLAAQLVTNGGFESGDFTGWDHFSSGLGLEQINSTAARSGSFGLLTGSLFGGVRIYSQSVATSVGQRYDFSFWISSIGGDEPASFEAFWDTSPVYALTSAAPFSYSQQLFSVVAAESQTNIVFVLSAEFNTYLLDDVSVVEAATVVPEPSSMALMAIGLLGVLAAASRRIVSSPGYPSRATPT